MTLRRPKQDLAWEWLGRMDYQDAERLQGQCERARRSGEQPDTLLLLEHPHVYTLGRSASENDILVDPALLREEDVQTYRCDRGGKVTYHGPGQLVGYLIMNLQERRLSVPRFVWLVEEAIRCWLEGQGLTAERRSGWPGLWCEGAKVASLGFHISRHISRHGFALNLNPDLKFFEWIVPCGARIPVTSLEKLLGKRLDLSRVADALARQLEATFDSNAYSEELVSEELVSEGLASPVSSSSLLSSSS